MNERWWVADARRDDPALKDRLHVSAWMHAGASRETLSSDRQSAAVLHDGDTPLIVKWRRPLPERARRTFLRPSRERLEARAALRARALDIPAPAPWAVGELRRRGLLLGAVLVRAYDAQACNGAEAAAGDPTRLAEMARSLRAWHERGFRHGDCYPKNLLVDGPVDEPRPIGFPKARFVRVGPRLDRARRKDLAQFAAGCVELGPEVDPFGFLGPYADYAPGLPAVASLTEWVQPAFERVMARKAKRMATRPAREPDGPPAPRPLPAGFASEVVVKVRPLGALI